MKLALLKRNALAAPFLNAFSVQNSNSSTPLMSVYYRDREAIHVQGFSDRTVVIFETAFKEEEDQVFAKEFVDARRQPSIQTAPQVLYSKDVPKDLESLHLTPNPTTVLFPRHYAGEKADSVISHIQLFRDYLHYHIKASKAYMHTRMRSRTESFLKVLNRAKPDFGDKEKKTMAGKTFKR